MADFRSVTEDFAVSPQISIEDVRTAATQGFVLIVNNRPDGESADQPAGASIAAAAEAAGLAYRHIPVVGRPSPEQVDQMREAVGTAGGKTLAFCRSGTRSIVIWALGEAQAGRRARDALVSLAAGAGYDLSAALPR